MKYNIGKTCLVLFVAIVRAWKLITPIKGVPFITPETYLVLQTNISPFCISFLIGSKRNILWSTYLFRNGSMKTARQEFHLAFLRLCGTRQTERRGNRNILCVFHRAISVEIRSPEYDDCYYAVVKRNKLFPYWSIRSSLNWPIMEKFASLDNSVETINICFFLNQWERKCRKEKYLYLTPCIAFDFSLRYVQGKGTGYVRTSCTYLLLK